MTDAEIGDIVKKIDKDYVLLRKSSLRVWKWAISFVAICCIAILGVGVFQTIRTAATTLVGKQTIAQIQQHEEDASKILDQLKQLEIEWEDTKDRDLVQLKTEMYRLINRYGVYDLSSIEHDKKDLIKLQSTSGERYQMYLNSMSSGDLSWVIGMWNNNHPNRPMIVRNDFNNLGHMEHVRKGTELDRITLGEIDANKITSHREWEHLARDIEKSSRESKIRSD